MKKILIALLFFLIPLSAFSEVRLATQLGYWADFNYSHYDELYNGFLTKHSISLPIIKNWELQINAEYGLQYRPKDKMLIFVQPNIGIQYNFKLKNYWSLRPMLFFGYGYNDFPQVDISRGVDEYLNTNHILSRYTDIVAKFGINLDIAKQLNDNFELLLSVSYDLVDYYKPFQLSCGFSYIVPKKNEVSTNVL
jgi:outer membrane receptor protein involved in Fe transport